jgi:hypothetical protein
MPGLFTSASHGLVCMWKPPGISTRLLDNVLVRLLGPHTRHARVGHLGTLDPAASGVVVLTLGRASLLAPYLDDRKCYDARVKFGISTRSDDATGAVDARADCRRLPDLRERVEAAVARGNPSGIKAAALLAAHVSYSFINMRVFVPARKGPWALARGDVASIDLRGIGSGSTLTLLNGRRMAPHPISMAENGVPSLAVNINTIPREMVDRVEILRDGASSI